MIPYGTRSSKVIIGGNQRLYAGYPAGREKALPRRLPCHTVQNRTRCKTRPFFIAAERFASAPSSVWRKAPATFPRRGKAVGRLRHPVLLALQRRNKSRSGPLLRTGLQIFLAGRLSPKRQNAAWAEMPSPGGGRCPAGADEGAPAKLPVRRTAMALPLAADAATEADVQKNRARFATRPLGPLCCPPLDIHASPGSAGCQHDLVGAVRFNAH